MGCLPGIDGRDHCRGGGTPTASALRRTAAGRYETAETRDERRSVLPALKQMLRELDEAGARGPAGHVLRRSEEHTSELQSLAYLVCRLLLEKKKKKTVDHQHT